MSREIKFRGKRVDNGEFVYGYLVVDKFNGKTFIVTDVEVESVDIECADLYATEWYQVNPNTVGQFSNLKDKDGREVYEGDVVQVVLNGLTGTVVFIDGAFCINRTNTEEFAFLMAESVKVIGTIHDKEETKCIGFSACGGGCESCPANKP